MCSGEIGAACDTESHAAAQCSATILRSFKNDVELSKKSETVTELAFKNFAPFEPIATEDMRAALFAFFEMGARVISGRFTATRLFDRKTGVETWRFEDHQKWMQ